MTEPNLASEQDMDRAIGHALAWWNHVEDGVGDVFCAVFGGVNNRAARGAYLAVVNFNARLQMVNAAASAIQLDPALSARWKNLRNRADKKSGIRNKLTHFSRMIAPTAKGETAVFVLPNFWEAEEWAAAMSGKGVRWTWPEIWEFGQSFGTLAVELGELARAIEESVRAQPTRFPPSTGHPTP
jgi:hypothetical protein